MKNINLIFLGGPDVHTRIEFANYLRTTKNFNIFFIGSEDGKVIIDNGFKFFRYDLDRGINIFRDLNAIKQLRKILKKLSSEKTFLLQIFDTKPNVLGVISAIGIKNIIIVSIDRI